MAFLAGDNAEYITGTANVIDGGNMIPETSVMGVHSTEQSVGIKVGAFDPYIILFIYAYCVCIFFMIG